MTTQVGRLPVAGLCALAIAGFLTILTEALPAGLLPQIGGSLEVSEAMAGQCALIPKNWTIHSWSFPR
ncbi:major facilitator superfamily MFS_1 domain protein (plasmid) [Sinorhizobium sp. RAC02]|nr:major facilitator superfamily MFS_1 domain protein [Sinorhizobium sp. RAC02]